MSKTSEKIPPETFKFLKNMFFMGQSDRLIATSLLLPVETVARIVEEEGYVRGEWDIQEVIDAKDMLEAGRTREQVAHALGRTYKSVEKFIERNNNGAYDEQIRQYRRAQSAEEDIDELRQKSCELILEGIFRIEKKSPGDAASHIFSEIARVSWRFHRHLSEVAVGIMQERGMFREKGSKK